MNPALIAPGVSAESREENGKLALHFSITHRRIDRANIIMFPIMFISLAGLFFICFLFATIMGRQTDMIIFELGMAIIIALCIFRARAKLKKVPKTEEITVYQNESQLELYNPAFNSPRIYDLKEIKGAWIYEYFMNGTLMAVYIVLSQSEGKKKIKDNSPLLFLPVALDTGKKLHSMYRLVLIYIEKMFPWVSIGYDDSTIWESIKKVLI